MRKCSIKNLILYIIIITLIAKVLPLWSIINTPVSANDIIISYIILFIYFIYTYINNTDTIKIYMNVICSFVEDKIDLRIF